MKFKDIIALKNDPVKMEQVGRKVLAHLISLGIEYDLGDNEDFERIPVSPDDLATTAINAIYEDA